MRCRETRGKSPIVASPSLQWAPNNSFKPNLLRYTKHMAEKACHVFGSTAQVGLTQALDAAHTFRGRDGDHSNLIDHRWRCRSDDSFQATVWGKIGRASCRERLCQYV